LASEGLTSSGIELLQEAAERLLKGYLIAKGWHLVRTHDLVKLLEDAASYDAAFGRFRGLASALTADFFAQHYPGHDMTNVGKDYEKWRNELSDLISLIASSLPTFAKDLKK
jgi:HEPN domain-containing protein